MNTVKVVKDVNYTTINNTIIRDERISLKAKGLFLTIMSLPASWDFTISGICSILKEEKTAVYAAIRELKTYGYCTFEEIRENGRFVGADYTFYELPQAEEPHSGFPHTEEPHTENQPQLNTNNNKVLKEEREARAGVTYTKNGTRGIAVNNSINNDIETYIAPIRDLYGGTLADEFRWGNACVKAIEARIEPDKLISALSRLMTQNRNYPITPENVLQFALEERAKAKIVKSVQNGLTPEQQEQRRQIALMQENYYASQRSHNGN